MEQIFNLRLLSEKYSQHQQDIYHMFIDFKKAFDRVWHAALWDTMKMYNINHKLISLIQNLYKDATSAVISNGSIGEWFRTTVGVRQGCLLSPTLFNIFLERIMTEALKNHEGSISIGGRKISNLRFADDIDAMAGSEEELAQLAGNIDGASKQFGMEISAEKTKLMVNNASKSAPNITLSGGEKLETVDKFKYLGSIISEQGSKPEILARIAQSIAGLTKLKPLMSSKSLPLTSKVKLTRTLAQSIFLYGCEAWTLNKDLERRIQAFEMRCYRKILNISYKDHVTNNVVRDRITNAIGPHLPLLSIVRRRKLDWFGHTVRSSGLTKVVLQGTVNGARKIGRQKKRWESNIMEWTGLSFEACMRAAENRKEWRRISLCSSAVPLRSSRTTGSE